MAETVHTAPRAEMKRKIAAILAADIAQYSRLVAENEEEAVTRLGSYREVFGEFVSKAGGRVFNTAGDAVLAEFSSAVEATRCAIDIQESMRTRNLPFSAEQQMLFRIGITIGDVFERGTDLLGDGVNIAARLESLAPAGGICVSRGVYEQVANKISVHFRDIGSREVKNIPQPVHAFMVEMGGDHNLLRKPAFTRATANKTSPWSLMVAGGAIALLAAGLSVGILRWSERPGDPPKDSPGPTVVATGHGPATGGVVTSPNSTVPADATPAEAFAILARSGGIVQEPRTVPELYHNARSYEARGDTASARRDYLAMMTLGTEAIDAHLRFAALLRAVDGRSGARETYERLAEARGIQIADLVLALSFDGDERRKRIEAFAASHPDYAPAQMMLAEELSESRLGVQTLTDRRREHVALAAFLAADREGKLSANFLDQSVLSEWLDRARRRDAGLAAALATATDQPNAKFLRSGAGWSVSVSLPEPATKLSWRLGDTGAFITTGQLGAIDQRTGRAMPNPSFELAADSVSSTLWLAYEDAAGHSMGPFAVAFDPRSALIEGQRELLDRFWNSWVSFGSGSPLVFYTHLLSYRCAIANARMGFDDGPLSTVLVIPPCNQRDPFAIPAEARPYLSAPAGLRSVSVQLTYATGEVSEVRTFRKQ